MLGGSEFRLRQGFGLRPKRLYGAKAPPARRPVGWFSYTFWKFQNIDFNRLLQDKKPPCGGFFKKLGDENLRRHERKIKPTKLLSYNFLKKILNSTPYTLTLKK